MAEKEFDKVNLATWFTEALTQKAEKDEKVEMLISIFPFLRRYNVQPDGPMRWRAQDSENPDSDIVYNYKELARDQVRDWILEELNG